jgi:hypothetical protein
MSCFCYIIIAFVVALLVIYLYKKGVINLPEFFDEVPPIIEQLKLDLARVHPKCAKMKIVKGKKSYTINKEKIYLCLHDKKTGHMYDKNMLTYVLIHEMAHVLNTGNADPSEDIGHTDAFYAVFDKLLKKAEQVGVYDPSLPLVDEYCT